MMKMLMAKKQMEEPKTMTKMMPARAVTMLLPQMTSSDKDFRFMATNDLMTELQKDSIKLDDDSERKVGEERDFFEMEINKYLW